MKYELTLNGRNYEVEVEFAEPQSAQEFASFAPAAPAAPVAAAPVAEAAPVAPAAPAAVVSGDGECVPSPMPGNILKVHVSNGQTVNEGDILVILEAMKMENEILAPKSGTVSQVCVSQGATVETGSPLVFIR